MKIRTVTFDCAQTLLDGRWNPVEHAFGCLDDAGVAGYDRAAGAAAYQRLLKERYPSYPMLNETRDPEACRAFWIHLTEAWLRAMELSPDLVPAIMDASDRRFFGTDGGMWRPFADVRPTLEALRSAGYRLGVVSNWDITLEPLLVAHGLRGYFDVVLASLVEGVEKPDPRLFRIALSHLETPADEAVHVGDHPEDDIDGAHAAGMRAYLIDRAPGRRAGDGVLTNLLQIVEALG